MNRGIWFSHMQCCSKSVECSQTFLNWNWKNYVKLNVKGHKQKVTVNCIVLFVSSRFLFLSVKIGPNMENPSATSASFGSFATWKHCIRWSRGIQVFVTKWQKWGKTGEWANCDGIEGGMWQQRARTWGREQLVSDKLRTLPQSTTTCLVHAFKQVAHKLLQFLQRVVHLPGWQVKHVQTLAWACSCLCLCLCT